MKNNDKTIIIINFDQLNNIVNTASFSTSKLYITTAIANASSDN
jgi:hypothetical protein